MPYGNLGWNLDKFKVGSATAQTISVVVLYEDGSDSVNTSYNLVAETSASFATIAGVAGTANVRAFFIRPASATVYAAEQSVATPFGIPIPCNGLAMEFRQS